MRQSRRAMTLVEALVALGIAFILGLTVFYVVTPSFRLVQEGQIRTELQQQGELALQQLTADLQNTVPTGVSLAFPSAGQGMIVATHPMKQNLGSGILDFQRFLQVWYLDLTKQQLFRKKFEESGDPSGQILTIQTSAAIQTDRLKLGPVCAVSNGTEKSYALSVETFSVEKEYTSISEVYACRILLQKDIPGKNRKAVVELFRKVMLRNHY